MIHTETELQQLNEYYRRQFLHSYRSENKADNMMTFIVSKDTDVLEFAKAAKIVWESVGDYPNTFLGFVKTEEGNAFATFEYQGAIEASHAVTQ